VTTAAFDEPFDPPPDEVLPPPEDVLRALLPLDDLDEELLPRDDAAEERRLDALELFGLLPELEALLRLEALLPFEPFELREVVFFCDCELAWAMSPP
jgi:hypothetical protein